MLHKMAFTSNFMGFFVCGMPFYGKRFPARQPPLSKPQALKRYLRLSYISLWKFPCIKGRKRRPKREGPFYGRIVYPCGKVTSTTVTTKKHATHSSTCSGYQNRGTVVLSVVLYIFHQRSDFLPPVLLQPTRIGHSPWYT